MLPCDVIQEAASNLSRRGGKGERERGDRKKDERWVEDAKVVAGGHTEKLRQYYTNTILSGELQHRHWQKLSNGDIK